MVYLSSAPSLSNPFLSCLTPPMYFHTNREGAQPASAANHRTVLPVSHIKCIVLSWNYSEYVRSFQNDFIDISCFLLYRRFCGLEPRPKQTLWMRYRDHRVPRRAENSSGNYSTQAILTLLFWQSFNPSSPVPFSPCSWFLMGRRPSESNPKSRFSRVHRCQDVEFIHLWSFCWLL